MVLPLLLAEPGLTHQDVPGPAGPYEHVETVDPQIAATANPQAQVSLFDVLGQGCVNGRNSPADQLCARELDLRAGPPVNGDGAESGGQLKPLA